MLVINYRYTIFLYNHTNLPNPLVGCNKIPFILDGFGLSRILYRVLLSSSLVTALRQRYASRQNFICHGKGNICLIVIFCNPLPLHSRFHRRGTSQSALGIVNRPPWTPPFRKGTPIAPNARCDWGVCARFPLPLCPEVWRRILR